MDHREEIVQKLQVVAIQKGVLTPEEIGSALTIILNDYEVTKRETGIIPYEGDANEEMLKRFAACMLIEGKKKSTVKAYIYTLKKMADALQMTYTTVQTRNIRFFLATMMQRGLSNTTVENARANISAFYQWMTNEGIITANPCAPIKPIKQPDVERLPYSDVELDKIRSACDSTKKRAMVEFFLATGVRVNEFCNIKFTDVDMDTNAVYVKDGKGGKDRVTYINAIAAYYLKFYLAGREDTCPMLFCNYKGEKLTPGGVREVFRRLGEAAEVDNVHPHRFRRTFATGLAKRGMQVQYLQKLLGHTSIDTTMEYVALDKTHVEMMYKKHIA